MNVIKRNGTEVRFDKEKIYVAISKANDDVKMRTPCHAISDSTITVITNRLFERCKKRSRTMTVEEIQDMVETELMKEKAYEVAKSYIRYRYKRTLARDKYTELMNSIAEKIKATNVCNQNANVDEKSFGGRIGEMSSLVLKQYALDYCMSPMARDNHMNNEIYTHDLDHYPTGDHNCLSVPFDDLLAKGFNTRQTDIRPAGSVSTAFQLVAVIFQIQSLSQFGGVSATHLDWTMVPYVRKSFYKHYIDGMKYCGNEAFSIDNDITKVSIEDDKYYDKKSAAYQYATDMTVKECHQAVEGMYHNLNTLQSRSGNQLE